MMINDRITDLEELAGELRKLCREQTGIDPAHDRRSDSSFHETRLGLRTLSRIRDALQAAARLVGQLQDRNTEQQGRITRLQSSNGALMVDRDRGIREAGARREAAYAVAERALAAAGIDTGELANLVADERRYSNQTWTFLDAERERLEAFRLTMVNVWMALDGRDGLTAIQVGKLRRIVSRANAKACGRNR